MSQSSSAFVNAQFEEAYPDGVENHYWNLGRNLFLYFLLKNEKGKVLEIGAGRGIVVQFLNNIGLNVWGCELSPTTLISANLKERVFLNQDAFKLASSFREDVTTILLLDMLEHLRDPETFLAECEKKFPNLEKILITLPARQELWSNYDEKYGHYMRYDLAGLCPLLSKLQGNWQDGKQGYFFHLLYPMARVLLKLSQKRDTTIHAPHSSLQRLLHKFLGYFFYLEARFLPKNLPGTSVYLLLERA